MDQFKDIIQSFDEYFTVEEPSTSYRRNLAGQELWVADTFTWICKWSPGLNKNTKAGHSEGTVSQATGALVLMTLIILVMSTLYMGWRVYYKKKYLTIFWIKEHGQPFRPSYMDSPSKLDKDEIQDSEMDAHTGMELARGTNT